MKKLIIQRLDTANYFRKVAVLVEGKSIGKVSFAETAHFEISTEAKSVNVKLDWCKSLPFELDSSLNEEVFFVECSSNLMNAFSAPQKYLSLHKVKKKDLPTNQQILEFRGNFKKVTGISTLMLLLFGVFLVYTLYVAIFENSPLWYALSALAGYNIYRISKGIRQRVKGQV
ncbi:hypothetical protein [Owenweeksia hongkongensis]|uniref:hypothetical protein n=1 Tax=Owenweeksia hongkongensis TaxID=253245 RepID=UPI003A939D86